MDLLTSTNGLVLFLIGLVHLVYLFFAGSKSIMRIIDVIAILFGTALWQYPEKVHAIINVIFHSSK